MSSWNLAFALNRVHEDEQASCCCCSRRSRGAVQAKRRQQRRGLGLATKIRVRMGLQERRGLSDELLLLNAARGHRGRREDREVSPGAEVVGAWRGSRRRGQLGLGRRGSRPVAGLGAGEVEVAGSRGYDAAGLRPSTALVAGTVDGGGERRVGDEAGREDEAEEELQRSGWR